MGIVSTVIAPPLEDDDDLNSIQERLSHPSTRSMIDESSTPPRSYPNPRDTYPSHMSTLALIIYILRTVLSAISLIPIPMLAGLVILSGCGVSPVAIKGATSHLTLSADTATLAPGQTAQLTITSVGFSSSTVSLTLQCASNACGTLEGKSYIAPAHLQNESEVTITANSSISGVPPSSVTLTLVPPPTIVSITPNVIPAGTTHIITVSGTGFVPGSTVEMQSTIVGGPAGIENVSVVSATTLTVTISTPEGDSGTLSFAVVSPFSSVPKSSAMDVLVSPAIAKAASSLGVFDVNSYGASGSALIYSCSGKAGSNIIACDEPTNDFLPGQGIRIVAGGGLPHVQGVTSQPLITRHGNGTIGTHMYCYIVGIADALGGITRFSPQACIDDEPLLSYATVYNTFTSGYSYPLAAQLWYVSKDGEPFHLVSIGGSMDVGQQLDSRGGWPRVLPAGNPDISKNEDLFTSVKSVQGNQIVLNDPLLAPVSHTLIDHDDSAAIQRAIDAAVAANGGIIQFGSGQYNIRRPTFPMLEPNRSAAYMETTTNYSLAPSWARWAYISVPLGTRGNIEFRGEGGGTVLQTPPDDGGEGVVFGISDIELPGYVQYPLLKILDTDKGSTTLILASAADAHILKPGDDIWIYGGSFATASTAAPCIDSDGTAGGGCHFSELNTVKAVQGDTVTLMYPTSKRYYDDGRDSFGVVKLPIIMHNIRIEHLAINTYDPVLYGSIIINLVVDNVKINGLINHCAFGGGYKRNVLIENSSWGVGMGDASWSATDEYDQWTNVDFVNNTIVGYAAPGAEGPSLMAKLYMTEGSSDFTFEGNTFNHVSLYFQDTTDDTITNNRFVDGIISAGSAYSPYSHPFLMTRTQNQDFLSFASQQSVDVDHNVFNIDAPFSPPWVISTGHFQSGTVNYNTITFDGSSSNIPMILSNGGTLTDNSVTIGTNAKSSAGIVIVPDQAPGVAPSSFNVSHNTITADSVNVGIYAVGAGFTNDAPICIQANNVNIANGKQEEIASEDAASLGCR